MSLTPASCPMHSRIIERASQSKELEQSLDEVLRIIKNTLYSKVQITHPSMDAWITIVSKGRFRKISTSEERAIILDEIDLRENFPEAKRFQPGSLHGMYIGHPYGKIFLVKTNWCLKTLIHETLHSTSVFINRPDLYGRYQDLVEGLTEFYTGYILFNNYNDCYKAWKGRSYDVCSFTYEKSIQLWGAICHFIGIEQLASIYFWQGHNEWERCFQEFIEKIREAGYPNFKNILQMKKNLATRVYLTQECLRNFESRFEEILSSPNESLDYSSMKK